MTRRFRSGGRSVSRRFLVLAIALVLGGLAIGSGTAVFQRTGTDATSARTAEAASVDQAGNGGAAHAAAELETETAAFPLEVKPGKRYLVDAAGTPFPIHGDTAWSLIAQLGREDVDRYLKDRRARGFNTILVSLIEHQYATNAPANAYGEPPFLKPEDYSTPNEAYFAHADWILRRAAEYGVLVLLTPSYAGAGGGTSGWYGAMVANGPSRLRQYGEYLGRRYRDFTNILWIHAGDYNPPRKDLVRAIAEGIRESNPRALQTAHGSRETAALDYWRDEPWLQVNTIYTAFPRNWSSRPVYATALQQYARPERVPFFLIEGVYEYEHDSSEWHLRVQAYQSLLSGAAGQVFGNNPMWYFDGPGFIPAPVTWERALGSRGAQSMTHLRDLLTRVPWWQLKPDLDNTLLTGGIGPEAKRAVAARAADRSFAILYLPSSRAITIDLGEIVGPEVIARWYDPADGRFREVVGSPFSASGLREFRPEPGSNSSGFDDWALILESHS